MLPIGDTTVTVTAIDVAGNLSTTTFTVGDDFGNVSRQTRPVSVPKSQGK